MFGVSVVRVRTRCESSVVGGERRRRRGLENPLRYLLSVSDESDPASDWADGRKVRWVLDWEDGIVGWRRCGLPVWEGSRGWVVVGIEEEATVEVVRETANKATANMYRSTVE